MDGVRHIKRARAGQEYALEEFFPLHAVLWVHLHIIEIVRMQAAVPGHYLTQLKTIN